LSGKYEKNKQESEGIFHDTWKLGKIRHFVKDSIFIIPEVRRHARERFQADKLPGFVENLLSCAIFRFAETSHSHA